MRNGVPVAKIVKIAQPGAGEARLIAGVAQAELSTVLAAWRLLPVLCRL